MAGAPRGRSRRRMGRPRRRPLRGLFGGAVAGGAAGYRRPPVATSVGSASEVALDHGRAVLDPRGRVRCHHRMDAVLCLDIGFPSAVVLWITSSVTYSPTPMPPAAADPTPAQQVRLAIGVVCPERHDTPCGYPVTGSRIDPAVCVPKRSTHAREGHDDGFRRTRRDRTRR